jgi:Rad3-related DNA helicase
MNMVFHPTKMFSKGYFMSNPVIPPITAWITHLQELSIPFQKYGSFLPEQRELIDRVYQKMEHSEKKVWIFDAPPASGKTHVICLLSRVFRESGQTIAIVVPSNYLQEDFRNACSDICGGLPDIDIMNLHEYLVTDKQYDYVMVDEAHNLKSFLEFEGQAVKNLNFSLSDDFYLNFAARYLSSGRNFVAQQVSFASVKDMLDSLKREPKFKVKLQNILDNPTSWRCFVYIWKELNVCTLKFVQLDDLCTFKLPSKHLLLFSATQLSDEELNFYCGIPSEIIDRAEPVKSSAEWRNEQRLCISVKDSLSDADKLVLLKALIKESNSRTLVLFNNFAKCKKAFKEIKKNSKSAFLLPNRAPKTPEAYTSFLNQPNGVLFTSSTVFWEGITIKDLKLLVVIDPPFPRPRFIELLKGRPSNGKVDMARRLEQGLGRIGRKKGDSGIAILCFDLNKVGGSTFRNMFPKLKLFALTSYESVLIVHKFFVDKSISVQSAIRDLITN